MTAAIAVAGNTAATGWADSKSPLVFAAASLKNVLDAINDAWRRETGKHATIAYAASSTLAKQIENGAPADLFISADRDWMNYLDTRKLINPESRSDLLGNSLVLIAPASGTVKLSIAPDFGLAAALGDGRLAMADPAAVPAGRYGKAALEKLGVWSSVEKRIAAAENVRAALLLVARGEAPLGIVYSTDAAAEPNVKIVGAFPADSHPPIIYPAAETRDSKSADARLFLDYLKSTKARPALEKQGFTVLVKSASST